MNSSQSLYDQLGLAASATVEQIERACRELRDRYEDGVPPRLRQAFEVLGTESTRRVYDYLCARADSEPKEGRLALFRDSAEAALYAAYAKSWGFTLTPSEQPNSFFVGRVVDPPPHESGRVPRFERLPALARYPAPLVPAPSITRVSGAEASPKPVFRPRVTPKGDSKGSQHTRPEWPLEPIVCGCRVYYLAYHFGFIEQVVAAPQACQATCHVEGDRTHTITAANWNAVAFRNAFQPGDRIVVISAADRTFEADRATYAMVTSFRSGWSFEPPYIFKDRWERDVWEAYGRVRATGASAHFRLSNSREADRARYGFHFALRAASIQSAFDWTTPEGMRELTLASNRYVAEMHPSLKRFCRPR